MIIHTATVTYLRGITTVGSVQLSPHDHQHHLPTTLPDWVGHYPMSRTYRPNNDASIWHVSGDPCSSKADPF